MRLVIEGVIGEIDSLQGCSQIAVSHGVYVPPQLRGEGRGTVANKQRLATVFRELGYDMLICTIDQSNVNQRRILERNGWTCYQAFTSRRTGHVVELWGCVNKEEPLDG